MKILVTGGLGFIGHNVVAKLENLKHQVTIVDNRTNYGIIPNDEINYLIEERSKKIFLSKAHRIDIVDNFAIDGVIEETKPDMIIHLASFPRQKVVNSKPQKGSRVMSEGLLNLLEASKNYKVGKFVYISSSMVYGDFTDNVNESAICNPRGQYGIMKLAGEWLTRDYTRSAGISHTIVRPSAVYGPLDVEDRVAAKFMLGAMRGDTLKVNGKDERLDFTHVDDTAKGIVLASLSNNAENKTYNITRGVSRSLLEAAELSVKIAGKGSVEIKDKDNTFPSRGSLDISAARKDLGYEPKIDIEEGFKDYYNWLHHSLFWFSKTV